MSSISNLVNSVLKGELSSCGPLLDLLEETNDCFRRQDLHRLLGELSFKADDIERQYKDSDWNYNGRDYSGRDYACNIIWKRFSCEFRKLFWDAVTDSLMDRLVKMEEILGCIGQSDKEQEQEENRPESSFGSTSDVPIYSSPFSAKKVYRSKLLTEKKGLS